MEIFIIFLRPLFIYCPREIIYMYLIIITSIVCIICTYIYTYPYLNNIYKMECVRCVRTCEACGRSTRVRLVGRPKNIVSDPACIYFAPRRVVRPNSISRVVYLRSVLLSVFNNCLDVSNGYRGFCCVGVCGQHRRAAQYRYRKCLKGFDN